jgi:hypothetical protein
VSEILLHLADQLHRAAQGGAWHGPSLREALDGVDATSAAARPVASAHSIWELVRHLHGTYRLVLRRLEGDDAPLAPLEDWAVLPAPSEENWRVDVALVFELNARLQEAVRRFPVERLFDPLVAYPPYSAFTQFVGVTQHDLYHAGQIVLLKRMASGG